MGYTVNFCSHKESYKDKQPVYHAPEDWLIFENTHEAIIDRATWELVPEAAGDATPHRHAGRGQSSDRAGLLRRLQGKDV